MKHIVPLLIATFSTVVIYLNYVPKDLPNPYGHWRTYQGAPDALQYSSLQQIDWKMCAA